MKSKTTALVLGLLVSACGNLPPPQEPVAPPPTSASVAVPTDGRAPTPPIITPPIDPSLPKSAAFAMSLDVGAVASALANPEIAAIATIRGAHLEASMLTLAAIDTTRPCAIALFSVTDETRRALASLTNASKDSSEHPFEAITAAYKGAKTGVRVRALIPTTDADKTVAAFSIVMKSAQLEEKLPGIYADKHMQVRVSRAGGAAASKASAVIVVDLIAGDGDFNAFDAEVKSAHVDPPALDGRFLHIRYSPLEMAEIQLMNNVELTVDVASGEKIDPSQRERIAAEALDEASGTMLGVLFEQVDVSGKNDGGKISVDLKTSDSPYPKFPPPATWNPSPALSLDQGTGVVSIAGAMARGWVLPGENAGDAFTRSKVAEAARSNLRGGGFVVLPLLGPVLARMFAHEHPLGAGAYEKFDRAGFFFDKDGKPIFFGLLPKETQGVAAQCALTGQATCPKESRLKVDGEADLKAYQKVRLIHVKGSKSLALLIGDDKKSVDEAKLSLGTAPAFEFSIPRHMKALDIPGLPEGAHVNGTYGVEGHTAVIHVETK